MMWIPIWPGMDPRPTAEANRRRYRERVANLPTVRVAQKLLKSGQLKVKPSPSKSRQSA